ncbi:MAG: hypothetical protein RL356_970 [Actinomycetota bacterium]|jgi:hypothetical protein
MQFYKRVLTGLIVVSLLTSCSEMSSGVTVGKKEIKASEIQKSVDEVLVARKNIDTSQMELVEGPELLRNQAQFVIISNVLDKIATDMKLSVTPADIAARRANIITQIGGEGELPKALVGASLAESNLNAYLRILIISERVTSEIIKSGTPESESADAVTKIVTEAAAKLGVKVNAKYGKWNPKSATIDTADVTDGAVTPLP